MAVSVWINRSVRLPGQNPGVAGFIHVCCWAGVRNPNLLRGWAVGRIKVARKRLTAVNRCTWGLRTVKAKSRVSMSRQVNNGSGASPPARLRDCRYRDDRLRCSSGLDRLLAGGCNVKSLPVDRRRWWSLNTSP